MSEEPQNTNDDSNDIEEWKPEPRTWTWSDLFAAPMLAFKFKCMVISLITLAAVGLIGWVADAIGIAEAGAWTVLLQWLVGTIQATVFILGSSLVATVFKADLLDDEFLSLGESLKAWSSRIVPSLMVPIFMSGIMLGFWFLVWGGTTLSNIPYVGPVLYPFLYPLAFPLSLMTVLISIAVFLAIFVAPAIIAIRKHSWLDNVIDTFEAVGTKPHVLVTNALVTALLVTVAFGIAGGAMGLLVKATTWGITPGSATEQMQAVAHGYTSTVVQKVNEIAPALEVFDESIVAPAVGGGDVGGLHRFMGHVLGVIQVIFVALIIGYCVNLWIAGGMMTYLYVREDDYWDDSDLEDFDKLAKELEEEARQAEAAAAAEAEKLLAEQAAEEAATEASEDASEAKAEAKAEAKPDEDSASAADSDSEATAEESDTPAAAEDSDGSDEQKEGDKKTGDS